MKCIFRSENQMDIIDKLSKEQEIWEKQKKVSSKVLDEIITCYKTSLDKINIYLQESYMLCIDSIEKTKMDYGAGDITEFSIACADSQNHMHFSAGTGLFLSALINNCKENNFVIYTNHLQWPVDFMFYNNL